MYYICICIMHIYVQYLACLLHVYAMLLVLSMNPVLCINLQQCVAVYCSVVQCVAVWCSVLQRVAVCCSVLQCVAVCCSVLQHTLRIDNGACFVYKHCRR